MAPAGWGKTSLLSCWATTAAADVRVAWVSLDESDDGPTRFWSYVLTALHASGDITDAPLRALGAAGVPAVDLALPMLLNELAATTARHVLVLDDYHVLTDPRIHEAVEYLITYLPPHCRAVIAGRADPPLAIARLRARGDLTEIRAAQLSLAPAETATMVSAVAGRGVDDAVTTAVWERTEGWAAGVQLAALAIRANPAGAAADDRHLLDYFATEVLPGLAPRQRDLLVRAAPLERLCGPRLDAALETTGSAEVLAELVHADLFVSALDDERQWYRCHRLLRDTLSRQNGDPSGVLTRAAAWFADHGQFDEAIRHLLRAGHHDRAAELLESTAETWFFPRGAAAEHLRLGEQLPAAVIGPALAYTLACAAALCGERTRMRRWLDLAEATATPGLTVPGWHSFRAAVLCWRAAFALPDSESARCVTLVREVIDLEAEGSSGYRTARIALGGMLARDGRFNEAADQLLDQWPRRRTENWQPWIALNCAGTLALSLTQAGRGEQCDRVLREAAPLAESAERDGRDSNGPGLATLRIAAGRRQYERGSSAAAIVTLRRAVDLAAVHSRPSWLVLALLYLADAELACGDRAAAQSALARARDVVEEDDVSPYTEPLLTAAEARIGRGATRAAARTGALREELTDRELSILRALQGPATQREIGAALFLSINTVKAYSKSLYRKLGVASRQDAITEARSLGLI